MAKIWHRLPGNTCLWINMQSSSPPTTPCEREKSWFFGKNPFRLLKVFCGTNHIMYQIIWYKRRFRLRSHSDHAIAILWSRSDDRFWIAARSQFLWSRSDDRLANCDLAATTKVRGPMCPFVGPMQLLQFRVLCRRSAGAGNCFFKENARRRNPATFLGFTFIVFCQVQCVLGSQVSVNSHVMLPALAGCRSFFQGKMRLAGIAGKFQSWNFKGICWPRSTVSKGDVGSCDSHLTQRVSLFEIKSRCEVMRLTLPPKRVCVRM